MCDRSQKLPSLPAVADLVVIEPGSARRSMLTPTQTCFMLLALSLFCDPELAPRSRRIYGAPHSARDAVPNAVNCATKASARAAPEVAMICAIVVCLVTSRTAIT